MLVAGRARQNCVFFPVFATRFQILGIDSSDSGRVATLPEVSASVLVLVVERSIENYDYLPKQPLSSTFHFHSLEIYMFFLFMYCIIDSLFVYMYTNRIESKHLPSK